MELPEYEELMARVLARMPEDLDKREGSLAWTAAGPLCAELVQGYQELSGGLSLAFWDTSSGEWLDRLAAGCGLVRREAEAAVCRGEFFDLEGAPLNIPAGMRFGLDGLIYRRGDRLEEGVFAMVCETPGLAGNKSSGTLLPVDYLQNLGRAEITALISAGAEAETDDSLRSRIQSRVFAPAFGGNIADYREQTLSLSGVGAVKVEPVPEGGGTVRLWLLGEDLLPAGDELVEAVQAAACPEPGAGRGFAPIGHQVEVKAAVPQEIEAEVTLTLAEGASLSEVKPAAQAALEGYYASLRAGWSGADRLTVRLSGATMALLSVGGVLDAAVRLNGGSANIELLPEEVPVGGSFTAKEAA